MIDGVKIHPLRQIPDERGKIMHMLREDSPNYQRFGEIYFSCVYPGAIKGWHLHREMTLNYAVVVGHIKLVVYDDRERSPTRGTLQEIFTGESNYCLVTVPNLVWIRSRHRFPTIGRSNMADGRPRQILILGGLGFFGSRLAAILSETAHVTVTARSISAERQRWLRQHEGRITGVTFDSARDASWADAGVFDCVVNLATPSAAETSNHPEESRERSLRAIHACLEALASERSKRLVHFSTFHAYGFRQDRSYREEAVPQPAHHYGKVHVDCEELLQKATGRFPVFIVRPTNMVGCPAHADLGVQSSLIFLDLCRQAACSGAMNLRSNGQGFRDFVPMPDAIEATRLLSEHDTERPLELFNLASGSTMRLEALAFQIRDAAERLFSSRVNLTFGQGTDSFVEPFKVSNDRLRALGWKPRDSLKPEIQKALTFFKSRPALSPVF